MVALRLNLEVFTLLRYPPEMKLVDVSSLVSLARSSTTFFGPLLSFLCEKWFYIIEEVVEEWK